MIYGEPIILRAIERRDLPDYVRCLNDPQVLEFYGSYTPLSLTQEEKWYEAMVEDSSPSSAVDAISTCCG
jgi:diamine N-acetyltransferase